MVIYAFPVDGSDEVYSIHTPVSVTSYTMNGIPPGAYEVVAYRQDSLAGTSRGGGYTAEAVCGIRVGCDDHTLIPVMVTAAAMTTGIDLTDWFAPMPPKPGNDRD